MNNSIRTIPWLKYAQLMILALQHNSSSSQHPCALVDKHACPGYIEPQHRLSMWFSLYSDCHRSAASPSSDSFKCFASVPTNCPGYGSLSPTSAPPPQSASPVLLALLLLLPSFFCPTQPCMDSYNPFQWSGTPTSIQPVFWRTVVSVDIFVMHPRREMNSTPNNSSTILIPF